ncbi:uncharacterized protein LOC133639352 isoform X1 [Entelurus aequoreus]|uniref:uncharacterized protein LOC133639352 isoform X1 n=1 Tax=Entelurus aequoreus TaxID=161455 RepID=UPI002B1DC466|nr:uncharacterized protein LOC133639352 isoform X1 [Entelurus aequoreus]
MDIECQEQKRRRCGACCLVGSILVLCAAVACVTVLVQLQCAAVHFGGPTPSPDDQCLCQDLVNGVVCSPMVQRNWTKRGVQNPNVAYLEAKSSKLVSSTMLWESVKQGSTDSVGSNFEFRPGQGVLEPKLEGTYLIHLNLNLSCTSSCSPGRLTVLVGDKPSCEVELAHSTREIKRCCVKTWMDRNTPLLAKMKVPKDGLQNWKLELIGSNFSMLLLEKCSQQSCSS